MFIIIITKLLLYLLYSILTGSITQCIDYKDL